MEKSMITETDCFPALGRKFEFVAMENPRQLRVRQHWCMNGEHCCRLGLLNVTSVEIEILKRYGIWSQLSPEVQKELENMTVEERKAVHNLMDKARAGRRQKYPNVPRELECITCHTKVAIPPCVLVKRVEKIAKVKGITYTLADYVKTFQCQTCHPTKGRRANPDNANLPKELVCKCGAKVKTSSTALRMAAERKKITIQEYVAGYKCQKCCPTKGRHFRGKKGKK